MLGSFIQFLNNNLTCSRYAASMPSRSRASRCSSYSDGDNRGGIVCVQPIEIIKDTENTANHSASSPPRTQKGLRSTHLYIACNTPEKLAAPQGPPEVGV